MKKFRFLLVIGGCCGLFLGLFPSGAQALGRCSVVCTPTASCDLQCAAIGGGSPEITTCGDWGRCAGYAASDLFAREDSTTPSFDDGLTCSAVGTNAAAPVVVR
jgi:hypothetical protein